MIASLIGMGISLAAGGWKAVQESRLNRKRKQERDREFAKNQAETNAAYAKQYYENPLTRADNAALLNHMKEMQKEQAKRSEATAVITGATPESVQAQKNAMGEAYAKAVSDIAANNQAHKDNVFDAWQNAKQSIRQEFLQNKQADYEQKANNIAKFGELGAQLGKTAMDAYATEPTKSATGDGVKTDVAAGTNSIVKAGDEYITGNGLKTKSLINKNSPLWKPYKAPWQK